MAHNVENMKMTDSDGKEVRYSIKEIENGFLISVSKEWKENEEYMNENSEYYSETNPFAEQAENLYDIMKSAIGEE